VLVLLIRRVYDVCRIYAIEMTSNGMYNTKFHDDWFRNSSNIKHATSTTWEAIVSVLLMRRIYELRH
jgi:hypothetical protein